MKRSSIQTKIALMAGLCLFVVVSTFIGYSTYTARQRALLTAQRQAVEQARLEASRVEAVFEHAFNVTRTVTQTLVASKQAPGVQMNREGLNEIMRQVLVGNDQFLSIWADWEPNAFDGRDAEYANKPGYTASGRYNFWNIRDENGEVKADLVPTEDNEEATAEWYQVPKKTLREYVVEPMNYPVEGKPVLQASVEVPIVVKGQFLGLVGADFRLDFLQQLAEKMNLYEHAGKLLLLSHQGIVAGATRHADKLNQPLSEAFPSLAKHLASLQNGQEVIELAGNELRILVPLQFGKTTTPWGAMILIPTAAITAEATQMMWRNISIGAALLVVTLLLLWLLAGRIAAPIRAAAQFATRIANGESVAKVAVTSDDETGLLLTAMNSMLENANSLLQTREERDKFQRSVMRLIDEISGVADGDLTRQANVTSDLTGSIAHSFNYMIKQLRNLIAQLMAVSREVNLTAKTTQNNTQHLAGEAQGQADQLIHVARELDAVACSIRNMSEIAEASKAMAQKTIGATRHGATVLQNSLDGIVQVRAQMTNCAQHFNQVDEHAREIGTAGQIVEALAKRTGVLALHASIQAANAGDAGRGVAVAVREVGVLAERSLETAKAIGELVNCTTTSTQAALSAMEKSTRGMSAGAGLIGAAAQALVEVEQELAHLAELIESISQTTETQSNESAAVSHAMIRLSEATRQTATAISRSALTVTQLAALANELNGSIASFKLTAQRPTTAELRQVRVREWGSGQSFTQH